MYTFPQDAVALVLATLLCFFAASYSIWVLPFSPRAALWHFWITGVGLAIFWLSFYLPAWVGLGRGAMAALLVWFASGLVVALAQIIFVVNFAYALTHIPRLNP
jgi:hypothetical protein